MEQWTTDLDAGLYQSAFDNAAVALMIFDLDAGRCVKANSVADETYGYRAGDWQGVCLSDLYECRAASGRCLKRLGAKPPVTEVLRHKRRDGTGFWAAASLSPIAFGAGRYAVMSAQDVTRQQDALAELSLMRDHYSLAEELTGVGYCIFDLAQARQSCSAQQYRNFDIDPGEVPGDRDGAIAALLSRVHGLDRERAAAAIRACVDSGVAFDAEWRVLGHDGERIVRVEGVRKEDADCGRAFVFTSVDLTESRRTEESLRQTRLDLSRSQQIARVGTWMLDLSTGLATTSSEETRKIFGFDSMQVPVALLNSRIHPEDLPAVELARNYCLAHPGTGYYVQYRVIPHPGELRYVESQAEVQTDAAGKAVRMVGYLRDVTEAKLAEQEIERLAYHDELTGLPNRVSLRRELERATSIDAANCVPLALMVIDVTRFQDICLTVGLTNSDALLRDVAVRLSKALGEEIFVARIGGSQFALILSDANTYESKPCARTVLKAFEAPFLVAGIQYDINVHVGIALYPGHASDPVTLYRKANVALFRARQLGTDLIVYNPEDDPYKPERLALLGEFRRAIEDGQIELYCQPKVEMRTEEVIGAEALVRWRHPQRGMISPAHFVPLIENTELIHVLTRYVLQAAVRQCFNWQREGMYVPLAVNVSPRNLLAHDLVPCLETLLHTWGGSPDWLGLEITESSLITDPDASIAELSTLSAMGFRLFVDDFGTGYSSLSYLTRMPVSVIKVDHGFTMRMLEDRRAAAIVKSTIELAHNLGMTVVAEGTASKGIWDALVGYGCDEAQGYYVAEPFPVGEFGAWLQASGRRVRPHDAGAAPH
jgi:diguanylate cyclase (GGDEF)-like protein/PAS domain S-box-containing protein